MQIVWTETALRHLAAIQAYIEQDKPQAARDVAQAICRAVAYLAAHPHLGRPGRKPGTRELIIPGTPYLVPYQVQGDRLTIVAVLHGAQRRRESPD
ncbi:MAG: type II toxin-antitoxin system RelE/ParE family toxin [Terriglobia bacterium]|jgi:toxin ParE1/3/4